MAILQEHLTETIRQVDMLNTSEQEDLIQMCVRLPNGPLKQLCTTFALDPDFIPVFYYNMKRKQALLRANDVVGLKELVQEEESYCLDREEKFAPTE